ncbi:hypothetical protein GEMRC1_005552 [Eukaryota sp. GEM-RC1]
MTLDSMKPLSVNYHFTRKCNFSCKFCFHTRKSSFVEPIEEAQKALSQLADHGMQKLNVCGGEPFLYPDYIGELMTFAKTQLATKTVSVVTNGSKVTDEWFQKYAEYVDIIAVSCDSFNDEVNRKIGRGANHVEDVYRIRDLCAKYGVSFKINTVVCSLNIDEDMNSHIAELKPCRWKCFQVLLLDGENTGEKALRDARHLTISDQNFLDFIDRHKENNCVPEDSSVMMNSYLILDEYLRFLNCTDGNKRPTGRILDIGVPAALSAAGFDPQRFLQARREFFQDVEDIESF